MGIWGDFLEGLFGGIKLKSPKTRTKEFDRRRFLKENSPGEKLKVKESRIFQPRENPERHWTRKGLRPRRFKQS